MKISFTLIRNGILIHTLSLLTAGMAFAANCPEIPLDLSDGWSDGGYSFRVNGTNGVPADNVNNLTQSTLRLFEDGVELRPAHSHHVDIRNSGQGRFSHWSNPDGTGEALRFSSSDDTYPGTNGKRYSICLTSTDSSAAPTTTDSPAALTTSSSFHAPAPTSSFVVNVRDKGASGNGVTDDTMAIQNAINQVGGTGGTVFVPAGTYLVTSGDFWPRSALNLKSNMTFKMDAGAVIKLRPNAFGNYAILYIGHNSNVNVVGGKLLGERHSHLTSGDNAFTTPVDSQCPNSDNCNGQWGFGIYIYGSSNVYIDAVESREMWGDGFVLDGHSTNVNFYSVVADDNRRQGMTLYVCDHVVIRDSIFKNTYGHKPQDGIDIEPDKNGDYVSSVQILNNQFLNNHGSGVHVVMPLFRDTSAYVNNILIQGNTITNNGTLSVWGAGVLIEDPNVTSVTATGNIISGSKGYAGILLNQTRGNTITNNSLLNNTQTKFGAIRDFTGGNTISGNTVN
ncbi:MAG: right-handed parallel beta-helix repeat-containing protein [Methylococcales bacterium]|nr:right-handed parallel beta-helix repeat-containing protein [Methylococcales bacterium]